MPRANVNQIEPENLWSWEHSNSFIIHLEIFGKFETINFIKKWFFKIRWKYFPSITIAFIRSEAFVRFYFQEEKMSLHKLIPKKDIFSHYSYTTHKHIYLQVFAINTRWGCRQTKLPICYIWRVAEYYCNGWK